MKLTSAVALFVAAVIATVASASAQDHMVKANVPFNFSIGAQTLPSGTYTLTSGVNNPGIVHLSDSAKKLNVLSVGMPNGNSKPEDRKLVFHKYGSQYFLADILCADASMSIHFFESKSERRAKEQVERAGLAIDAPVLLALN